MTPENLRIIRKELQLTQTGLAEALGIKNSDTVSKWETGYSPVPEWIVPALRGLVYHKAVELAREIM